MVCLKCLRACVAIFTAFTVMTMNVTPAMAEDSRPNMRALVISDSLLQEVKHDSTVQVEFQNVSLEDLANVQVLTKDGQELVHLEHHSQIEVTVFVPENLSAQEKEAFLKGIEDSLNSRYPQAVYKVRELLIPTEEIASEIEKITAEKSLAEKPSVPALARPETRGWLKATAQQMRSWGEKTKSIAKKMKASRYNARAQDLVMGASIGLGKSAMGVSYWLGVTGFNFYGIAQAALSVGLDTIFHVFPVQINRWKGEHEFPYFKSSKAVSTYNNSPLLKAFAINQAIHFTITYLFRLLSHLDDPENITSPNSVEFLSIFGGLAAVGTPIGAAGDMGVRALARKGYISGRTEHYIFNIFGLELQINGLLFGSGRTEWLPLGLAVEWGGKIVAYALAKTLKAKSNRIVIVHPDLVEARRNDILYMMGMENALNPNEISKVSLQDLVGLKESHYRLNCESYLRK